MPNNYFHPPQDKNKLYQQVGNMCLFTCVVLSRTVPLIILHLAHSTYNQIIT
jgi:hypothetical protein